MFHFETDQRGGSRGIVNVTKGTSTISFSAVGRGRIPVARSIVDFTLQGECVLEASDDAYGENSNVKVFLEESFFELKRIYKI